MATIEKLKLLVAGRQGLFYLEVVVGGDFAVGLQCMTKIHPAPCWGIAATNKDRLIVASRKVGFDDIQEVPTRMIDFDQELLPTDYVNFPQLKDCHQLGVLQHNEKKLLVAMSCATNEMLTFELDHEGYIHEHMQLYHRIVFDNETGWDVGHWNAFHFDRNKHLIACRHGYGWPAKVYAWKDPSYWGKEEDAIIHSTGYHGHNIVPWIKDKYFTFASVPGEVYTFNAFTPGSSHVVWVDPKHSYLRGAAMVPRFFDGTHSLFIAGGTENVSDRAKRGEAKSWLHFFNMGQNGYTQAGVLESLQDPHVLELEIGPIHELFVLDRFDLCRPENLFLPSLHPGFHL